MVVGVIIDNFHRCRDQIEASCGIQRNVQSEADHIVDGKYEILATPNFMKYEKSLLNRLVYLRRNRNPIGPC